MAIISRLAVLLGLDAGEFNAGLGKAKDKVDSFSLGAKIGLGTVAAAFVAAGRNAIMFADEISDVAKANEVAVSSVLGLSQALTVNGGSVDSTARIFSSFTNKVDEAIQGSGKLRKSFQELGISTKDLASLTEQQLFEKTLVALSKIEDPVHRNALAFELLSKAVKGVDIKGLGDDYAKAKEQFKDSDKTFNDINTSIDEMKLHWMDFKVKLANDLLPFLQLLNRQFEVLSENSKKFAAGEGINKWASAAYQKKSIASEGSTSPSSPFGFIAPMYDPIKITQANKLRELGLTEDEKKAKELLKTQTEFYDKEVAISKAKAGRLQKENEFAFLGEAERKRELDLYDIQQKLLVLEIEKKMTKEQIAQYGEVERARVQEEYRIAQSQKTFEYGWKKAYTSYVENATNAAKMGEQAFVSVTQNMESALDTFVSTGKLKFGDLARSIIADLIKIQMRAQMTSLFSGLGSLLGFGGGGAGMFTGSTGMIGGSILKGSAGGNELGNMEPSIVGENGPELFIPKSAGTVVPNNRMGSLMGGGPQVVYNGTVIQNMQAIDTQSAQQFLAKNKQAIWSANQSAQRSLPQSR
jgi:lambda family phage tail tape measure protein